MIEKLHTPGHITFYKPLFTIKAEGCNPAKSNNYSAFQIVTMYDNEL